MCSQPLTSKKMFPLSKPSVNIDQASHQNLPPDLTKSPNFPKEMLSRIILGPWWNVFYLFVDWSTFHHMFTEGLTRQTYIQVFSLAKLCKVHYHNSLLLWMISGHLFTIFELYMITTVFPVFNDSVVIFCWSFNILRQFSVGFCSGLSLVARSKLN